jgi:hypothetical protein
MHLNVYIIISLDFNQNNFLLYIYCLYLINLNFSVNNKDFFYNKIIRNKKFIKSLFTYN